MQLRDYLIESKSLDKVVKIVRVESKYGKNMYIVELTGKKWPSDSELIKYCDKNDGYFGGKVSQSADNNKQKYVEVNTG